MQYTNNTGIPLSVAVYLATDHYDYDPNCISATALLRPVRQVVLAKRVKPGINVPDISELVSSRMGTSIHDGIERAWEGNHKRAMKALGYPDKIIERVRVNPDPKTVQPTDIPVYMEIRSKKKIGKYTVSGKFDFIGNGQLEDFKSTSVYTWIHDCKDDDYVLQGSIYRWLNPELVTRDTMTIQFFFTDWQRAMTYSNPKYPPNRTMSRRFALNSIADTEKFIESRLALFEQYIDAPEDLIPECTDKELWRKEAIWKYYKNPANKTKSTKNFDNEAEAIARWSADAMKGEVVHVPGQAVACRYCPAFSECKQKDRLIENGELLIE